VLGVDGENEGGPCETMLDLAFEIIGTGVEFRLRRFDAGNGHRHVTADFE